MALVALLRGVNVGGSRRFRPKELAEDLHDLDVVSIGAAGTFVVRAPVTQTRLRDELRRRLPFETTIMICRGRDVLGLIERNPFEDVPARRDVVRFVSVLGRKPRKEPAIPTSIPAQGPWMLKILSFHGRFVVGVHRREMKAIRHLGALDQLFSDAITTRSWNTIEAIGRTIN